MQTQTLTLHWSTSRGRDTYGYNIRRITDITTGKHYRTCGGGYDMTGSVFGEWLNDVYADRLQAIGHRAAAYYSKAGGYKTHTDANGYRLRGYIYGMTRNDDTGRVTLDGACGMSCMEDIAQEIGLTLKRVTDRKGNTIAFIVTDNGAPVVQEAA